MSALEQQFHEAMIGVFRNAKKHCSYTASYLLQMVTERGGLAAARHLILADSPSEGFGKLWECGHLDLTVEAVALQAQYASLFTAEELEKAKARLLEYGYDVDNV